METKKSCPNCGKALADSTLQGICPECLMKAGWPTEPSDNLNESRFVPPEIEELAALFPQLEILELIGKGGMGAVYKARQPELDRFVALKILIPKDPNDPGFAERFSREARALARLGHPNIVAVYDFGHTSSQLHYFIMEYVDGPNLRDIEKAGEMTSKEALQIIPQICEALQFAHDEGIVHRDIKPENILLDRKGRVKIADFGLAKILGHEPQDLHLTLPGHVMGTPHYMAPEQVEHPQDVDHRADIYSLGVVFYEMLTGELPMGKFKPPSQKVQVDVRLDEVVLRTLAKEPELRYQQVSQIRTEVETIVTSPDLSEGGNQNQDAKISKETFNEIKQSLQIPGLGIFLAGLIDLALVISVLCVTVMGDNDLQLWTALLPFIIPLVIVMSASYLRQLKHYRFAICGTLLAFIPPGIVLGFPFGIWALILLNRERVRQAFTTNRRRSKPRPPQLHISGPSIPGCFEYRSRRTLWGLPLVHITRGMDPVTGKPKQALGIIAIGDRAKGVIAIGGMAIGGLALGGTAWGGICFGGCAAGLICFGGLAIGLLAAFGGVAVGTIAMGGGAIGYLAHGGSAWGVHAISATSSDPIAKAFFGHWAMTLTINSIWFWIPFLILMLILNVGLPAWLEWRQNGHLHKRKKSLTQIASFYITIAWGVSALIAIALFTQKMMKAIDNFDQRSPDSNSPTHAALAPTPNNVALYPNINSMSDKQAVDFNDPNFWQTQITRHLEGVRTLDCELIMERQSYGADQNTPERRSRTRFDLKWDRDHHWIDCTATPLDGKGIIQRMICGSQVGWVSHGNDNWTKVKAGSGAMMIVPFARFGEVRHDPYQYAFSIAQGIICSDMIKRTQDQKVFDWQGMKPTHRTDDQGRHLLTYSTPMPLAKDKTVNAELVLIGTWEREAFKLLELRGRVPKLGIDLLAEKFEDHLYANGDWVPQQATILGWDGPVPDGQGGIKPTKLYEKMMITAQHLTANQPMTAAMFDGFDPPVGDEVDDQITGTYYRIWPDFKKIRASGGKERVSVSGRVYLDGRPEAGITVATLTLYDPNSETHRNVKTTTDANGQFCLDGLIPGFSYRIHATDASGHTAGAKVHLSNLGINTTDLKIDMTSGLSVSGTVTDANGQPISKALVHFQGKSIVKTNDQGGYTINGLYADQGYEVEAVAKGYAPLDPGGRVVTENFRIQRDDQGQVKPFDIVLQKECILSGRVVDRNDQPVSGVRVNVWSSPFGTGDTWKWYDAHTDANGYFHIGNLGDRIYTFFVGQYGNVCHSPKESPLLFRVTGDSFMPDPLPGRQLVDANLITRAVAFEHPYRQYFRLKEFHEASSRNKFIHEWIKQLYEGNRQQRCEMLARLGSVPAYGALDTYISILGGQTHKHFKSAGTVTSFDSSMGRADSTMTCPEDLVNCQNPAIVCLTMRAVARCGFVKDHAALLINKLGDPNTLVRDYAQVALAELTGVSLGAEESRWQAWLVRYQQDRSNLDTRGPKRLFMGICRICRDHEPSLQSIERIMAAWQGASDGAAAFRAQLKNDQGPALWNLLASIDLEGENPIQYGHTLGYWPSDMFGDLGHRNHDLKFRVAQECTFSDKTFKPDVWYTLPALFRDAYIGQWEIVDLRFNDIKVDE